jgi:hypothetical protein
MEWHFGNSTENFGLAFWKSVENFEMSKYFRKSKDKPVKEFWDGWAFCEINGETDQGILNQTEEF